jgi:NAD+ synthase (glutamine-hydrolysing)
MRLLKVGAAALDQLPLDWAGNRARILRALEAARARGVHVLCLPELALTGYGLEDAFHAPEVLARALDGLAHLLPATRGMAVSVGLPLLVRNALFNVAAVLADGRLVGFVPKQNLAGDGLHYEPRWFRAWPRHVRDAVEVGGARVPVGDLHFDLGGVRIGFEICEDAWVADRPGADLARRGVDILLNPSASHFALGKTEVRQRFVLEGSRAFGCTYVYANLLGNEAGRVIYDGECLIASAGRLLARGERFSYGEVTLTTAVVDLDHTRTQQARTASFQPLLGEGADDRVVAPCELGPPAALEPAPAALAAPWEGASLREEELARAIALGLFDYLRKSRARGFVLSLSGGADSAACAVLVRLMVRFAAASIGLEAAAARLGHPGVADERALVGALLTTVYQSTRNSGPVTRAAARRVAEAVGARHLEVDVDAMVAGYSAMVSGALAVELDWARHDLALQNVQARARAPGVWMIANLLGALLLVTSNRSEAAVGYCTMDGDTAGSLSPIAGIDKAYLLRWLAWMRAEGPAGHGPLEALDAILAQAPTAELRPPGAAQTDEADLMPYAVLDEIEKAAIRDKRSPAEVLETLALSHPGRPRTLLLSWVERFFTLWSRNQWKRERYAPGFHLDDENLDPRSWCRFPILSAGYAEELAELRAAVAADGARARVSRGGDDDA